MCGRACETDQYSRRDVLGVWRFGEGKIPSGSLTLVMKFMTYVLIDYALAPYTCKFMLTFTFKSRDM